MSLPRRLKRLTAGAIAIVALAAAGLFAAPYVVSDTEARLAALRALRDATGAEPQVGGAVYLTLLPSPAVRIEEVRLSDGKRPAFTASALRANVQLLPLLIGHVEISSLTFEHAHLSVQAVEGGAVAVGLPTRSAADAARADLPEIRFERGIIQFVHGDGSRSEPLTHVDAAVAPAGSGVTASGSFRWRGQPATFNLSLADLAALERGNRSALRARIDGEGVKLGFDGGVAYRNGVQADGTFAAEAGSLRSVLSQLTVSPPVTRAGFGPFKLKAHMAVAANSAAFSKLSLELDGNRAEGGLTIKQSGARTVVQATLAAEHADLTPYSGGFAMTDAAGQDWSREPIDLSGLDELDLDMRFSAARVSVRKTELTRVAATASVRNGTFTLVLGDAQFHGGTLRGRTTINRAEDGSTDVQIEGTVTNFDLAPGLASLASLQRVEGKGSLTLALQSRGQHIHALTNSLDGTVTLDANGGALTGVNVEQLLRRLERNPLAAAADFGGGRTAFERLNARLRIDDGTARVEDARVESPQMRVQITGEASVVHRDFNLRGTATLMRPAGARIAELPFEFPFVVRGPWERPFLLPDPVGQTRSGALPAFVRTARSPTANDRDAGVRAE